jgi:polysaccharide export outer membrane protein
MLFPAATATGCTAPKRAGERCEIAFLPPLIPGFPFNAEAGSARHVMKQSIRVSLLSLALLSAGSAEEQRKTVEAGQEAGAARKYVLGPDDRINVWVLRLDEISGKTFTIDEDGNVSMPLIGQMHVAGKTTARVETELTEQLKKYLLTPQVSVTLAESRSQPVSIVGAVVSPGVYQLRGDRTLLEMLTAAGGLKGEAGGYAKIRRAAAYGRIPLPSATSDADGNFTVAEVNVKALLASEHSQNNIELLPHDVITVPAAQMIYVVGEVSRPGNYSSDERGNLTVLQALSMAGGVTKAAAPQNAMVLRPILGGPKRAELAVDLRRLLKGKSPDIPLMPNDILVVPDSGGKKVAAKAAEAVLQAGTQILTWGAIYKF